MENLDRYIQDPVEIELDGATRLLLRDVNEAKKQIDLLRPFSADLVDQIGRELLPKRIVATLSIEGISATTRQTIAIMDAMRLRETPERASNEIENTLQANELVFDLVDRGVELSESVVRELNKVLLTGIRPDAGIFRKGPVELPGAPNPPPFASDIPYLMNKLGVLYEEAESCDPIVQAAWVHAQFTGIHPFSDGNGRTGRLLQDYSLIRRGLLPVGIPASMRDSYYECLADADVGNWNKMVETLCALELSTMSEVEAIARRPQKRAAFIRNLSTAAAQKERETTQKKYIIWKTCIEGLISEFAILARDLNQASSPLSVEITAYEIPSIEVWEDCGKEKQKFSPIILSIQFKSKEQYLYKSTLSLQNHSKLSTDLFEDQVELAGLFFGGTGIAAENSALENYNDPHIRLREIVFLDSNLFVYHNIGSNEDWGCMDDLSTGDISQDLFNDVFYRKLGIGS